MTHLIKKTTNQTHHKNIFKNENGTNLARILVNDAVMPVRHCITVVLKKRCHINNQRHLWRECWKDWESKRCYYHEMGMDVFPRIVRLLMEPAPGGLYITITPTDKYNASVPSYKSTKVCLFLLENGIPIGFKIFPKSMHCKL